MKFLLTLLCGMAVIIATVGAAIWIHSWTIQRQNKYVCAMLNEQQQKYETDLNLGLNPLPRDYVAIALISLESERGARCADLALYGRALLGLSVLLSLIVLVVRRRFQDLVTDREEPIRDYVAISDVSKQSPSPAHVGLASSPMSGP